MDPRLALLVASLLEAYLLQHTLLPGWAFRTATALTLAINLGLQLVWGVFIYPYFVTPLRHLPTLSGNLNHARVLFDDPRGRLPLQWMKTIPNDGLIHFRDIFNRSFLLATNHQALLDIMSTNTYDFEKPWRLRDFLARIIGFGLILSEGVAHRKQRRALTPSFHVRNIRALYGLMWEKTGLLMGELQKEMDSNEDKVEMSVWASRLTLDIIGPAAMGRDFRSLHNPENKVADSFLAILEPTREKMAFLAVNGLLPQWIARRLPWRLNRVIDTETEFLRHMCKEILVEKKASIASTKLTAAELEADILGTMMMGGDFSDDELVDQMLTFLAAGHETTASAFTWGCYLLTQHPTIQTQLRDEIRARIPTGHSAITHNDLESLPLLNGVCQEVLRLYPTVPMTLRESVRDTTVAGQHVPRGTRILLCTYAINRCPEFWGADGEAFRPGRWIDTDEKGNAVVNQRGGAVTNYAQITFLHGQRACIGKDFARAELRCALAGIVGRFAMEMQDPKQEIHIGGAVTTKPVEGMHLRMKRVEGW
ncbi:cytochrome P450 [Aspergillus heteromorphus CBS 117.55]|uniref:Cytochrome P450 n=1 Tax=Aspergillus heteromorphus CBS 117.55 TaxID=1448321 RepID=A0A317VKV3_9EURO|nr:cytochrome P450 [Aspergillus heteromorphus CBS 117.55]PWY74994.1 cytochrome P450 [Aspergillus heteromorphus CBS 117.55]